MKTAHRWSGLRARFDAVVLQAPPPPPAPKLDAAQAALLAGLRDWCLQGAGPGCAPLLQPLARPRIGHRLAVATLTGPLARTEPLALSLMLERDGSLRMAERGRAGGLALRLQTKLQDALWWRPLQASDPWDCGGLPGTSASLAALVHFQARRPTLMVATQPDVNILQASLGMLRDNQPVQAHAVRLLVLQPSLDDPPRLAQHLPTD